MRTSSRATAILVFHEVELLDVALAASILSSAGRKWNFRPFKITAVAERVERIETRSQIHLAAVHSLAESPNPEIVIVPGGYGARRALEEPAILAWLKRVGPGASEILAVGAGVLLLGRAGLLDDTDISVSAESAVLLRDLAPTARPDLSRPWRSSGRIVSAPTSFGAAHGALHLVKKLLGEKHAREIERDLGLEMSSPAETLEIVFPPKP